MRNKVLIVDDSGPMRRLLLRHLSALGFEVQEAAREDEAKTELLAQTFDLVVTDVNLAQGNGCEVVRHTRALAPRVPVIVISAAIMPQDMVAMLDSRTRFVSKPFSIEALGRLAIQLLDGLN